MMGHLEARKALYDLQDGFRKKRCETQLLSLYHELAHARDGRIQTDLVIMDFVKAFDKVSHRHLAAKLDFYGIRGPTKEWIVGFLSNRSQQVVVEGQHSSKAPVTSGVPQGTVLGPILFLIYINDLPNRAQFSTVRLFADDCILQKTVKTTDDCSKLQEDINSIGQWEKDWLMEFHPDKCQILTIPAGKSPILHSYHLHNVTLQRPPDGAIKYLGITIQSDLKWHKHVRSITAKASRTLGVVRRNVRVPDRDVRERAYKTLVRPQVEFASSVWDLPRNRGQSAIRQSTLAHQVEMVQRRAARFVCNQYRYTSSVDAMLADLKWPKLEARRRYFRLCMMYRINKDIVAIPFDHCLICLQTLSRGHDQRYRPIKTKLDLFEDSFLPRTIPDWNKLSQGLVGAPLDQFKSGLIKKVMH